MPLTSPSVVLLAVASCFGVRPKTPLSHQTPSLLLSAECHQLPSSKAPPGPSAALNVGDDRQRLYVGPPLATATPFNSILSFLPFAFEVGTVGQASFALGQPPDLIFNF